MQHLILNFYPFLLRLPKAFCWGPGRTDEDILDAGRGCRLHPSAISGSDKTANRFLPLQCSGGDASFPLNRNGERARRGRGKGGKKKEQDLFFSNQVSVDSAFNCCGLMARLQRQGLCQSLKWPWPQKRLCCASGIWLVLKQTKIMVWLHLPPGQVMVMATTFQAPPMNEAVH